jgi:predicted nucleotidyltransferase/DNA-binding XRE family transcriptional regulator
VVTQHRNTGTSSATFPVIAARDPVLGGFLPSEAAPASARAAILTIRYIDVMPVIDSAGTLVRDARRRAGMTQAQLAHRAGITQSVVSAYESNRREPSLPVLLRLIAATGHALEGTLVAAGQGTVATLSGPLGRRVVQHRTRIQAIAASYGAGHVRVFGSVARGTEHRDSDVDLLMDLPDDMGLFTLGRLRRDLEDLLGAQVDVVPEAGLKSEARPEIEADMVAL